MDCLKRNKKLVISLFMIFLSGLILGCGVGLLLKYTCEVIIIGIGISIFAIAALLLKIYFMEKKYEIMGDLCKKDK